VRCARILVAEDLQPNQILVAEMLKGAGHDVQVVGNGAEAVEAVRRRRFDLVLMDVEMPEMDGLDATRSIRQLKGRHVPIIALSAGAMPDQEERCRAAGMDDFVAKPCSRGALLDIVGRWAAHAP
jgi:two-component system sensor histidine kinase/response regulator